MRYEALLDDFDEEVARILEFCSLDTGPFEATVGAQPEAYRWRIEGARGYPPRAGS